MFSFVTLHGTKNRSSQKLKLKNNDVDTFKRAKTDIFKVHSNFVGPIERVTVEHDNMGKSPGCKWFSIKKMCESISNTFFCLRRVLGQTRDY